MTEQVVSSKFGARPLLDVPALEPYSKWSVAPSIRDPQPAAYPYSAPSISNPWAGFATGSLIGPPPPPAPPNFPFRTSFSAPPGYYYPPRPFNEMYPGVHNPYYSGAPPPPPPPPQPPRRENYTIEGVLQYGRLTSLYMDSATGDFRAVPDFLKQELHKTYGRYPYTEVKITCDNGEFHIYATPKGPYDYHSGGVPRQYEQDFRPLRRPDDYPPDRYYRPRHGAEYDPDYRPIRARTYGQEYKESFKYDGRDPRPFDRYEDGPPGYISGRHSNRR